MVQKQLSPGSSNDLQSSLARYLLRLEVGDRLASIRELADTFQTSVGSISNALNAIEENGIVSIERRGRMGSFISDISLGLLWMLSETCPLVIGLTPATNLRYEGLATGIKKTLGSEGIEAYMIFIRGSYTRLKALRENRCHVIVTSSFAAEELCSKREKVLLNMPETSFVSGHHVFYRVAPHELSRTYRVAIDRESIDQARLTEMEFAGLDVEYVQVNYTQIHRLLIEGHVDAAVWTDDDMKDRVGDVIRERPLSEAVRAQVDNRDTSAAMIARADHDTVHAVIRRTMDSQKVMAIQKTVLTGEILPEY